MEHTSEIPGAATPRLRTGWRVLIGYLGFIAIEALLVVGQGVLAALVHPSQLVLLGIDAVAVAGAMLGFVTLLSRFVDRSPVRDLGLRPDRRMLWQVAAGVAVPAAAIAVATAVAVAAGWARFHAIPLTPTILGLLAFKLAFIAVSEGFPEELVFRGYLFRNLSRALPLWPAWLLTGVLFGVLHLASSSGAVSVTDHLAYAGMAIGFGLLATSARALTGALWMSMAVHVTIDLALNASPYGPASLAFYSPFLGAVGVCLTAAALLLLIASEGRRRRRGSRPRRIADTAEAGMAVGERRESRRHRPAEERPT